MTSFILLLIFHFPNTEALGKFKLKCLMSSTFPQISSKSFLFGYQLLQMNPIGKISQISILAKGKRCVKSVQIGSFFWSVFCRTRAEYGDLLRKCPYSVRVRANTHLGSVFGRSSCSEN